ncbi:heat shock cognate 71 kDa protein-like [Hyposmocoma kahamanoa]|uniref:heat shock cognate 71 kDa protein-like n=1 Tax=Hyposmocoma kahamanoa TaxID=1477025 RepID=UPI000E6D92E0|nr:heat shock cognate 71 kDa protein-like [Hyposmocoma kahamanoa]
MVLSKLKSSAEEYLGVKVHKAVVTVPAYFNDSQRQATKDAATIAGLNVLRIINEPTAGALAYGLGNTEEERNVIIFDLGGGTFDVSALTIEEGVFEVRATAGHTHLGGEDFDSRLVKYFAYEFARKHGLDLRGDNKALRRLRTACERAKCTLSSAMQTSVELVALHGGKDLQAVITRTRFERLNQDLFQKTLDIMQQVMLEAEIPKDDIADVVLIGGSTRIPYIQQMVREFFGKEPSKTVNPDEAVAHGAAIQAAILNDDPSEIISDVVLVDVVPLSLGIKVFGDIMNVIIKRNTAIPTKHTERYRTAVDNQTDIPIMVYEGERTMTADNNLLGEFMMTGVPPLPAGQAKVDVTFAINADGILHVSAVQLITQKKNQLTITSNKGRLSQAEIIRLVRMAESMKHDDEVRREEAVARNDLESMCRHGLRDGRACIRDKCQTLLAWLADPRTNVQTKDILLRLKVLLHMANMKL